MSKAVLVSIKKPYADAIMRGAKDIELRRRFTSKIPPGGRMYVYSSGVVKKVIGYVTIRKVNVMHVDAMWPYCCERAMIPRDRFDKYFDGVKIGHAIEVINPVKFAEPKELSEFGVKRAPQSYQFIEVSNGSI